MPTRKPKSKKKPTPPKTKPRAKRKVAAPAAPERLLFLRTCKADGSSLHSPAFKWPESGPVEAADWDPRPCCGYGLHGLLWGEGSPGMWCEDGDARWVVFSADAGTEVRILDGADVKYKVPRAVVEYSGDRAGAMAYLRAHDPLYATRRVHYGIAASGDGGTSTSGYGGTSTSGDWGTSTSGDRGTSTSGYGGTSTSGDWGTSTSGDWGTSTSGDWGTSTSGNGGTSTSGENGVLIWIWYDGQRKRVVTAEVGVDGIKPNTKYRCVDGKIEEVQS